MATKRIGSATRIANKGRKGRKGKKHSAKHKRSRNPGGQFLGIPIVEGAIAAVGAIGINALIGQIPQVAELENEYAKKAIGPVAVIAASYAAKKYGKGSMIKAVGNCGQLFGVFLLIDALAGTAVKDAVSRVKDSLLPAETASKTTTGWAELAYSGLGTDHGYQPAWNNADQVPALGNSLHGQYVDFNAAALAGQMQ